MGEDDRFDFTSPRWLLLWGLLASVLVRGGTRSVIFAGLALVLGAVGFITLWRRWSSYRAASRAIAAIGVGLLVAAGPSEWIAGDRRVEQAMAPFLDALHQYRARTGSYPDALSALSPGRPEQCPGRRRQRPTYAVSAGEYTLGCRTWAGHLRRYSSAAARWESTF